MTFYYRDLAVVGFNGTARGDCGYAVAVARHNPTGKYVRLSFPDAERELAEGRRRPGERVPTAPKMYAPERRVPVNDESDIKAFRDEGSLTLFREGLEFPASHNAVVLYVARPLLDAAGAGLQSTELEQLHWKLLSEDPHQVWVTCATLDSVFLLMDSWGQALLGRCVDQLVGYIASEETDKGLLAEAELSAEMALCAARDDALREVIFLHYGVALMYSSPMEVDDLFEADFSTEFKHKKTTWPAFNQQLERLADTLATRAAATRPRRPPAPGGGSKDDDEDAAAEAAPPPKGDDLMGKVEAAAREIEREPGPREKLAKAVRAAEDCRRSFPPDDAVVRKIIAELERDENKAHIKIGDGARLCVFASDPLFYLLLARQRPAQKGNLDFWEYLHLAAEYKDVYQEKCGQSLFASYVLEQAENIRAESAVI